MFAKIVHMETVGYLCDLRGVCCMHFSGQSPHRKLLDPALIIVVTKAVLGMGQEQWEQLLIFMKQERPVQARWD